MYNSSERGTSSVAIFLLTVAMLELEKCSVVSGWGPGARASRQLALTPER